MSLQSAESSEEQQKQSRYYWQCRRSAMSSEGAAKAESLLSRSKGVKRPNRANRAKRHCSSNIAVPLVSVGVFGGSGAEVGQSGRGCRMRLLTLPAFDCYNA